MSGQQSKDIIAAYYKKGNTLAQKSANSNEFDFLVLNEDNSQSLKSIVVNVQQTFNGLRVYKALGKVLLRDNQVISERNDFDKNIVVSQKPSQKINISDGFFQNKIGVDKRSVVNKLPNLYYPKNDVYILAEELVIIDSNSSDVWHIIADASNGEILEKHNLTVSCNFVGHNHDNHSSNAILDTQKTSANFGKKAPAGSNYNVFAFPVEAPSFGSRSIASSPFDVSASPEGWHSDGANNYTITKGNNVYAYSDEASTNSPGYSPDAGSSLNFDFPFAEGRYISPFANKDAAITNLFYANNKVHDVFYKFGFTESSRNFQTNNFNKGGIGGDAVNAEAFDGSGFNNANFNPGYEIMINGTTHLLAPRMQMYLFDRAQSADDPISRFSYNSPSTMVNRPKVMTASASFGKILFEGKSVTGNLAITSPLDACTTPATNSLSNKIALIPRGTCEFSLKALNAQKAGAIGMILYDPNSETAPAMGAGTNGNRVKIPALGIGKTEGSFLNSQIASGTVINVTLQNDLNGFKHSSLDNGIIIHEYGHGISNRLTGQGYSCLSTDDTTEQMGEGWSDYFALMLTARPGDTSSLARGIGTYSLEQPTNGVGFRPAKYSPDFSINDYTYARTNSMTENVHAIGFVWATMLWDLTWKYVEKYGYNSDVLANPNSGNAKALQLVVDGLKLQACSPTFIDGRDAILEADQATTGGQDKCMIWGAFAKRGLGTGASAGSKTEWTDQVESFATPTECALSTQDVSNSVTKYVVFPNPTYDEFFVGNIDKSKDEVEIKLFDMSGKLILTDHRNNDSKKAISTKNLSKGVYVVIIKQGDKTQMEKLIVR